MDVAFLISTFLWMAWLIYGLRVAGERDHWRRRFEATQGIPAPGAVLIQYGSDFTESAAQVHARAARQFAEAAKKIGRI